MNMNNNSQKKSNLPINMKKLIFTKNKFQLKARFFFSST